MTVTPTSVRPVYKVGDRIQIHRNATTTAGRITAIHRNGEGVEYVVRTDAAGGGLGNVLNIRTTLNQLPFPCCASISGKTR